MFCIKEGDAIKGLKDHKDYFFAQYGMENSNIDEDILDAVWNRTYRPEPEKKRRPEENDRAILEALKREEKMAGKGSKRVKLLKAGERPGNVK